MRVTNSMITKNSMVNINSNKLSVDRLNNQMTSQKKISRPSEDPVVAIRALRLRSNLKELSQYAEKNIPDAESWLDITESALSNMKEILGKIRTECVNGSNDTLKEEDRTAILKNLMELRKQIYEEGNASYAGRTVFTGYKTNSNLTFAKDDANTSYLMEHKFSFKDIEEKKYITQEVQVPTGTGFPELGLGAYPKENTVERIRLPYTDVDFDLAGTTSKLTYSYKDANGVVQTANLDGMAYTDAAGDPKTVSVTTKSLQRDGESTVYNPGPNEVYFVEETGELIFGSDVADEMQAQKADIGITYDKTGFKKGEVRPEHYYNCTNTTDPTNPIKYKKESQDISYTVAFGQTLKVNTEASEVLDGEIGRDIDEMINAVQAASDAHGKVTDIKAMMSSEKYSDAASQTALATYLEAAEKEATYADDQMQKIYGKGIDDFQGHLEKVTLANTDLGSRSSRLKLTKTRVDAQQTNFEKLQSDNEDRELSDILLDYTAAYDAYEASLTAASKATQNTLLNYL